MAREHLRWLTKHPGVGRTVLWGRNEKALAELSRRHKNTAYYTDFERMLAEEELLAVNVCLPPHLRRDYVVEALRHKCHVLCEKPVALSIEDALVMAKEARRNDRFVMVGYTLRFLPEIVRLKSIIDSGAIGQVKTVLFRSGRPFRRVEWFNDPEKSLGVFGELGIHGIDLARYLIDDTIEEVKSEVIRSVPGRRVDDNGIALLRFREGAIASIACSFSYPFFENELVVIGTKKAARVTRGKVFVEENQTERSLRKMFVGSVLEGLYVPIRSVIFSPYKRELAYFLDCALNGKSPACDIAYDLHTLRACLAIAKQGESVESGS